MSKDLNATIIGYEYKYSTQGGLVQGIKGNRSPKNALNGGNGSFIVKGESPKIIIKIKLWDNTIVSKNIYYLVKENSLRERVSEKYADKIAKKLLNQVINIPKTEENPIEYFSIAFDLLVIDIINKLN